MRRDDWSHLPDWILSEKGTTTLRDWLRTNGRTMTLLELDTERKDRGITPPSRLGR